jgi:hypothetical protein
MATGRIPTTANSPLTVKGDLFGYSTTQARVPVGNDGETLVADSSTTTGLNYKPLDAAGKNPLLNSAFQIWQRGTSISVAASTNTGYSADRWNSISAASQASTISRQVTNDTTNLPNIQYCARVQRNSGQTGTGKYYFNQSLETVNTIPFVGKQVTLSFYARKGADYSPTSSALEVWLVTQTGTDQSLGAYSDFTTKPIDGVATLTTTWQRFTFTGTVASTATEMAVSLNMTPTGTASTNDYFEVTGVQIELGATATTFSRAQGTIQGELAACQRYYWRNTPGTAYGGHSAIAITNSSTSINIVFNNPTSMRVQPTSIDFANLAVFDTSVVTAISSLSIVSSQSSPGTTYVSAGGTGLGSLGRVQYILNNNNTAGYFGASAEL